MLKRYEPWSILNELHNLLDANFRRSTLTDSLPLEEERQWHPSADVKEEKNQFIILVDLPGVDAKNLSLSAENNTITIQGNRENIVETERDHFLCIERIKGKLYKRFTLPNSANTEQISAKLTQGVLTLTIEKKNVSRPRKIAIDLHQ